MSMYTITFSPTGGVKKVADTIASGFACESISIDLTDRTQDFSKYTFTSDDICIIAAPVFSGRIPKTATERLMQMHGAHAHVILVAVYGNRAFEDALVELQDTTTHVGFIPVAGIAAISEHSIVRSVAASRPNTEDCEQLTAFAHKIQAKHNHTAETLTLPGNHPYRAYPTSVLVPSVQDSCKKCGLCAAKCPVGAISMDNPTATDQTVCIGCMRCISVCPNNNRYINLAMLAPLSERLSTMCAQAKQNELFL